MSRMRALVRGPPSRPSPSSSPPPPSRTPVVLRDGLGPQTWYWND